MSLRNIGRRILRRPAKRSGPPINIASILSGYATSSAAGVVFGSCLLLAPFAQAGLPASTTGLDRKALRADLQVLAKNLATRHMRPFHKISRLDFEKEVRALDRRIALGLDPDQAFVGMSRLVSSIGDGHTVMTNPAGAPLLGLRFTRFGGDYRLVEAVAGAGAEAALGGRLISVGGEPVANVEKRLMPLTPADETLALRTGRAAALLDRGIILHGLGLATDSQSARFSFRADDGHIVNLAAHAVREAGASWSRVAPGTLLSAQDSEKPLNCRLVGVVNLYCNFRSYQGLAASSATMFNQIMRDHPRRLIVDMRQNGGGNFCEGLTYVVKPISARKELNRAGALYVLIGPETFSAAMSNAAHFRQLTHALLVGEPIGEIPNSYQEASSFELPESHWTVRFSTRFYRFAPGRKNLIEPDKFIPRTWIDFRDGRDAALDWILAQPLQASTTGPASLAARRPAGGYMCGPPK